MVRNRLLGRVEQELDSYFLCLYRMDLMGWSS